MYQRHPSRELNALFEHRPFQGADPSAATFLFIGLDANYAEDLETSSSYRSVLDYHADGVSFWQRTRVHHPFLLPTYRGAGRRYHLNFARIGFNPNHAGLVSFVELLHVPTAGRNTRLQTTDFASDHLASLSAFILEGCAKHIFVSAEVARLMRATGRFTWLGQAARSSAVLPVLYAQSDKRVYHHLHFSNYGKFQAQLEREAEAIGQLFRGDG